MKKLLLLSAALTLSLATARADAIYQLTIQPIQVCDDGGGNCSNSGLTLFEAEGDKIWAQAGIDLFFLPFTTINSTALNTLNFGPEIGALGGPFAGNIVRMYFVDSIDCGGPSFGCGYVGANGVAIADDVFSFNGGIGRLDTIAHELGHNLGLGHDDFGAGGALNLMTAGNARTIPGNISDIFPDGADTDQLTAAQIAEATASDLLTPVPEPSSVLFLFTVLAGVTATMRRKKAA